MTAYYELSDDEQEDDDLIDRLRSKLQDVIDDADCATAEAERLTGELLSDRVYDVMLTETLIGSDLVTHLRTAALHLRAAGNCISIVEGPEQ